MTKCLVWFVGVFSQVDLYKDLSNENVILNTNLISKITSMYDEVYCIVCVQNKLEAEVFTTLANGNEDLKKCKFIFRSYGSFKDVLISKEFYDIFNGTLTHFIDSNTGRLNNMKDVFPYVKCIHVSKFLN